MSNKKEVNPFSIAFLDLMSSALAAVIILFVIVPKSDIQIEIADTAFADMKTGFEEVDSILMSWVEIMSEEEIAFILSKTDKLQANLKVLEESHLITQSRLDEAKRVNEQLTMRLKLTEQKLTDIQKQVKVSQPKSETKQKTPDMAQTKSSTTSESKQQESKQFETEGAGDFFFGIEAPLVTMINWEESKYDVTLHLKDESGVMCDYYNRKTTFGQWVRLPRRLRTVPSQTIIQNELAPGTYEVHAHLRRPRRGDPIKITGFAAIVPEEGTPKKVDFGEIEIAPGPAPHKSDANTHIGNLVVTENDIQWTKI